MIDPRTFDREMILVLNYLKAFQPNFKFVFQGVHRVPLLPEQLLLHPALLAAHLLPRQLPGGQVLGLQRGALDPHGARHRRRLLRDEQAPRLRLHHDEDEEDRGGHLHAHRGLLPLPHRYVAVELG